MFHKAPNLLPRTSTSSSSIGSLTLPNIFWRYQSESTNSSSYSSKVATKLKLRIAPLDSLSKLSHGEWARFRTNTERPINSMSSRLNWPPKISFIESTMCPESHVGRVHGVTILWEPLTRNGRDVPFVKRSRRFRHTGQQRSDTPITRPKSYQKKWGSDWYKKKKQLETE